MLHGTVDGQSHEAWPCQRPSGAAFHFRPHSKTGSWGKQCSPKYRDESSGASYCHCGGYNKYPASSICFLRFGCSLLYRCLLQDFRMLPMHRMHLRPSPGRKKTKVHSVSSQGPLGGRFWAGHLCGWRWQGLNMFKHRLSNEKTLVVIGHIGDEILPSYMGIRPL